MRILLVEDDELIALGILAGLRAQGFVVDRVASAAQAEAALATLDADAMILDLGLPDEDGMSLLSRLRASGSVLPILVLTARDAVADRVNGLRAGADDYMLKPFDLEELAARLFALVRRASGRAVDALEDGVLRIEPSRGEAWLNGEPLELSRRELALLTVLMKSRDRILSADQLKDRLYDYSEEIESNALSVHIHHLRRKLGSGIVETIRGQGYRFGKATS